MITDELLNKVDEKLLSNIVTKVRDGKTLTAQEQGFLASKREDESAGKLDGDSVIKTSELVDLLGVSAQTISNLAKDQVLIRIANGRYKTYASIKNYIKQLRSRRTSKHGGGASMEELRQRLIDEQGRKEAAVASLKELELKMVTESLMPEAEATEAILKLLTPLRRLLDALPRMAAAQANPSSPSIAELAIRNALDDRVFSEIEKIMSKKT
jgi:hypothetical protein